MQFSTLTATTNSGYAQNITADTLIATGPGVVVGVVVNSHTNGTLKLWDSTAASGTVLFNTITFASGPGFYPLFGARFLNGLYADVGGTINLTLIYN